MSKGFLKLYLLANVIVPNMSAGDGEFVLNSFDFRWEVPAALQLQGLSALYVRALSAVMPEP